MTRALTVLLLVVLVAGIFAPISTVDAGESIVPGLNNPDSASVGSQPQQATPTPMMQSVNYQAPQSVVVNDGVTTQGGGLQFPYMAYTYVLRCGGCQLTDFKPLVENGVTQFDAMIFEPATPTWIHVKYGIHFDGQFADGSTIPSQDSPVNGITLNGVKRLVMRVQWTVWTGQFQKLLDLARASCGGDCFTGEFYPFTEADGQMWIRFETSRARNFNITQPGFQFNFSATDNKCTPLARSNVTQFNLAEVPGCNLPATPTSTQVTSSPTPTKTLVPGATATPSLCAPNPPVQVAVQQQSDSLLVTVSAFDNRKDMNNKLKRVDPSNNKATNNYELVFPTGNGAVKDGNGIKFITEWNTYQFTVVRRGSGAITAPFIVTTDCGQWNTFAGGGPNVAPGIRPTATPVPTVQYPPLTDGEENTDPRCPANSKIARDTLSQGHGTWTVLPSDGRGYRALKFNSDGGLEVTLTYPGWGAFNHFSTPGDIRHNITNATSSTFKCIP